METCVRLPGETRPVPGHFVDVKIASNETGERFCVLESTLAAGGGLTSRRHLHRTYIESWFVVDGTLEFCSGNERLLAPAGSFVLAPPSSHHTFGNGDDGETHIVGFYAPGGMDRFVAELGRIRSSDDPGFGVTGALFNKYETEPAEDHTPAGPPVSMLRPGEGEHLAIGGGEITILADSAETGGLFALVDCTAPPGFPGPPLHRHRQTVDLFYVLEGELAVHLDGKETTAPAGSFVLVAPGTAHTFSNPSDHPVRFLGLVSPGGFEGYFRELALDPAAGARIATSYDLENV